jgi:hypothetical protein
MLWFNSRLPGSNPEMIKLSNSFDILPPWNAPRFIWLLALKLQNIFLPMLHLFDKCATNDICFNLSVLWWKAISGNIKHSSTDDGGIAYDLLPSITRLLVSYPFCLLYPKLHHQNIALRTLYLDKLITSELENKSSSKAYVITLGAGFDARSVRFAPIYENTKWIEFDLSSVISQKSCMYQRFIKRRPHYEKYLPILHPIDLNNLTDVQEVLSKTLHDLSIRKEDKIIFLTEATLFYINQTCVPMVLQSCLSISKNFTKNIKYIFVDRFFLPASSTIRYNRKSNNNNNESNISLNVNADLSLTKLVKTIKMQRAASIIDIIKLSSSFSKSIINKIINTIQTLWSSRQIEKLNILVESKQINSTLYNHSNITNIIDEKQEKLEAELWFSSVGLKLINWQTKPGIARHMGRCQII